MTGFEEHPNQRPRIFELLTPKEATRLLTTVFEPKKARLLSTINVKDRKSHGVLAQLRIAKQSLEEDSRREASPAGVVAEHMDKWFGKKLGHRVKRKIDKEFLLWQSVGQGAGAVIGCVSRAERVRIGGIRALRRDEVPVEEVYPGPALEQKDVLEARKRIEEEAQRGEELLAKDPTGKEYVQDVIDRLRREDETLEISLAADRECFIKGAELAQEEFTNLVGLLQNPPQP